MTAFVLMRLLESAPRRYDFGILLLSLGQIRRVYAQVAKQVGAGDVVLDIGCGTGSLTVRCAERRARVTGIDISPQMLDIAGQKVRAAGLEGEVELKEMSAVNLDETFPKESFDVVVSTLTFSELSDDEQRFVLRQCHRLLKDGGRLTIADEVVAPWPRRALHLLVRLPLVVVTYVLTQTTTHAVAGLESKIVDAGFRVEWTHRNLLGDFEIVAAVKESSA